MLSNRAVFPYSTGNLAAAVHGSKGKGQEGNAWTSAAGVQWV